MGILRADSEILARLDEGGKDNFFVINSSLTDDQFQLINFIDTSASTNISIDLGSDMMELLKVHDFSTLLTNLIIIFDNCILTYNCFRAQIISNDNLLLM